MSRSISEEFKDQKINDLLEDYIALEKQIEKTANLIINAIDETPARLDAVLSDKVNKIIQSSIDINKDINIAKSDIRQISNECQSEITKQAINTFSGIKQNFDQIASDHKKQLEILTQQNHSVSKQPLQFVPCAHYACLRHFLAQPGMLHNMKKRQVCASMQEHFLI